MDRLGLAAAVVAMATAGSGAAGAPGEGGATSRRAGSAPTGPSAEELERLWVGLGAADPDEASKAAEAMVALGDRAVAFLAGRFGPPPADANQVARLIARLDDARYAGRKAAYEQLLSIGRAALPMLRKASERADLSAEARSRAAEIMRHWTSPAPGTDQARRLQRGIEVLGRADSSRAKALLAGLAKTDPGSLLARLAAAALLPWDQAVQGVQCLLRVGRTVWEVGQVPVLVADVRNCGKLRLHVWRDQQNEWEIEVDGRWYRSGLRTTSRALPLLPGGQQEGIAIRPEPFWGDRPRWVSADGGGTPLLLKPGRHRLRVAVKEAHDGEKYVPPIRAVSGAVEIEIAAPPATAPRTP